MRDLDARIKLHRILELCDEAENPEVPWRHVQSAVAEIVNLEEELGLEPTPGLVAYLEASA